MVAFVTPQPLEKSSEGIRSAWGVLSSMEGFRSIHLTFAQFVRQGRKPGRFDVVWIHRPDTATLTVAETDSKFCDILERFVRDGGRLLLTQQAVHYLNVAGFEQNPLQDSTKFCIDGGYGRRLGFHSFLGHPLFDGLNGGSYICRPPSDITTRVAGFFGTSAPANGKVVAVDWDYIFLREDSKIVLEYQPGRGKIIAVGAYMDFMVPNNHAGHLKLFTRNCIAFLADDQAGTAPTWWDYGLRNVSECPARPESDRFIAAVPPAVAWTDDTSGLALKKSYSNNNYWDAAGERILTMGTENGGIEEVWVHPFMALRDYEVGIRFSYRDTVYWLADQRPAIAVYPAFFSRQYKFSRAYLKEIIVNDPLEPAGVVHYEYRGVYPAELIIRFRSNLRWMWPLSERTTGSVCHAWDAGLDAFTFSDNQGRLCLRLGGNRKPVQHLSGQFENFRPVAKDSAVTGIPTPEVQLGGYLAYRLEMNDNLDIVFSASSDGYDSATQCFERVLREPARIYDRARRHAGRVLSESLMLTTPDSMFNTGYRWALLATDRFFVRTPGMGGALTAGYATTRHGWDGGHKVNGRPGYGWYFGRDAEWSAFALLGAGDTRKTRSQLEFFNRFQDLNGKILHEASTSGFIHYDAADATPLYIALAGRYFRHTNDTAFLRTTWPNIRKSINFCFSTDTDRDGLIENTNVGHGWVEGGKLFGSHSTVYMAGAWGAALREASGMASFLKDPEADMYRRESEKQVQVIDALFWSENENFYAYGMNQDGTFRREQTILPAVPVLFGMTDRMKGAEMMKTVARNVFTTNWGARILREDSPLFRPTGYHYGSVWPLFTGWASLAEYQCGRPAQGYSHLMNNLVVYRNWGLGFVEEVLNGSEYKPSGVCAHQCWSETMVVQPAIDGMLGLTVNAPGNELTLAPQLPPQWDSLRVTGIRVGNQLVSYSFRRNKGTVVWEFTSSVSEPLKIRFSPALPAGTKIGILTIGGQKITSAAFTSPDAVTLHTEFILTGNAVLALECQGGIGVVPSVTDPKPGDPPEGLRVISSAWKEGFYQVETEAPAGSSAMLDIWSESRLIAEDATFISAWSGVQRFRVDFEPAGQKYTVRTVSFTPSGN